MKRSMQLAAGLAVLVAVFELGGAGIALARGGGANIMNSPGYQRRLQESRGYVTNQSGSILPSQPASPPVKRKTRRHH